MLDPDPKGVIGLLEAIGRREYIVSYDEIRLAEVREGDRIELFVRDRFEEILEKHRKRLEDIVQRELARLVRIKGMEIEDERAKTNYLAATGYLMRLNLELEHVRGMRERISKRLLPLKEDFIALNRHLYHYNRVLEEIKEDKTFGEAVRKFEKGTEIRLGLVSKAEIEEFLDGLEEEIEHLFLTMLGKILSGK